MEKSNKLNKDSGCSDINNNLKKTEILKKLGNLIIVGIKLSQNFSMSSNYDEMIKEYELYKPDDTVKNTIELKNIFKSDEIKKNNLKQTKNINELNTIKYNVQTTKNIVSGVGIILTHYVVDKFGDTDIKKLMISLAGYIGVDYVHSVIDDCANKNVIDLNLSL